MEISLCATSNPLTAPLSQPLLTFVSVMAVTRGKISPMAVTKAICLEFGFYYSHIVTAMTDDFRKQPKIVRKLLSTMAVIFPSYIEGTNVTDMTDILNTFLAIWAVFLEIIQYFVTATSELFSFVTNDCNSRYVVVQLTISQPKVTSLISTL